MSEYISSYPAKRTESCSLLIDSCYDRFVYHPATCLGSIHSTLWGFLPASYLMV